MAEFLPLTAMTNGYDVGEMLEAIQKLIRRNPKWQVKSVKPRKFELHNF